ncbi:hypothetical protein P12x_005660 [Tundrisphaera lichenicola]|uniref:hypothetical protein n=1 Tax=Tundrisphaera lichenicola TaxID=2029860 RepID=UPI003EC1376C
MSESMVDCPHCSTRVLPMTGRICPACRRSFDAPRDQGMSNGRAVEAACGYVAHQIHLGVEPWRIEQSLTERGFSGESASTLVRNVKQARSRVLQEAGRRDIVFGALWCFLGLALSAISFRMAVASGGGRMLLAWGPILFGGLQFLRGMMQAGGEE